MDLEEILYAAFRDEVQRLAFGITRLCPANASRDRALQHLGNVMEALEGSLNELGREYYDTRITRVDPDLP